ncbi:unnamed protein product, partial [Thlaspi arvense]
MPGARYSKEFTIKKQPRIPKETSLYTFKFIECRASPVDDNLFEWEAAIKGPKYSPYGAGTFRVSMHFPPRFPMIAPTIFYPNVSDNGDVYLYMLGNGWAPGFTIPDILMTLWGMLFTPRLDLPDNVNEDTLEYVSNKE